MYTQCPHCDAVFQLSTAQLKAANGEVRCGQCLTVFNALNHLSDDIPATDDAQSPSLTHSSEHNDPPLDNVSPELPAKEVTEVAHTHFDEAESTITIEPEVTAENTEASPHTPLTEKMDRFEEFLSTDAPLPDETDAESNPAVEAIKPADEEVETVDEFAEIAALSHEAASDEEASIEMPADKSPDETFDGASIAAAEPGFKTPIAPEDEFAEFDEYRDDADGTMDTQNMSAQNPNYQNTVIIDVNAENEAIIINEDDLAPINSEAYTDKPEIPKPAAETSTTPHMETTETLNVPSLILDDLHAAKAEQLRPSNTPWMVASLVLMLTLVLQVVYHSRDELVKDASLRPWMIQMCELANCTLTQPYDIKQIDIIGREVRSHPSANKALIASTTLINNASFVQPFPLLTVVFSDINGKKLALRRFTPREYLSNTIDLTAGMTPDMPVRVELELVDPGKAAVNYEFHAVLDPRNTRPLT